MNGTIDNCVAILKKLYRIQAKTGQEETMINYLVSLILTLVPEVQIEVVEKNIYVTKGVSETYPCIASHIDQVQPICKDITVFEQCGIFFGFDFVARKQVGLGADDKNGVFLAILAIMNTPIIKAVFFHGEETGCNGSNKCDMTFFDNVRYVVQCDRKGNSDFVNQGSSVDLCSKEFETDCQLERFGYKACSGGTTDVVALKKQGLKVSCVNLSVGYENQHKDNETASLPDIRKCWEFVQHILTLDKVYPHTYTAPTTTYGNYDYNYYNGYWYNRKYKQGTLPFDTPNVNPYYKPKKKAITAVVVIPIKEQRHNMELLLTDYIVNQDSMDLHDLYRENCNQFPDLPYFEFEIALNHMLN